MFKFIHCEVSELCVWASGTETDLTGCQPGLIRRSLTQQTCTSSYEVVRGAPPGMVTGQLTQLLPLAEPLSIFDVVN